jgi:hypothetical protein
VVRRALTTADYGLNAKIRFQAFFRLIRWTHGRAHTLTGLHKESLKTFLLKVAIRCQRFREVPLTHQDKAHRITQRVCFVLSRDEECQRFAVESLINPDGFDIRIRHEIYYKGKGCPTG